MFNSMKKLVMIGCEGIGKVHLEHFLQFKEFVELAGFCDLVQEKAQKFCDKAGSGKAYKDFRTMYDEVNPDMVFICVPPFAHGDIELETIRRGIHFFVEKPLALTVEMAKDIAAKAEQAGLITAAGFQCRYSNLVDPTLQFIRENPVVLVDASRITGVPDIAWWAQKSKSGGMLLESTIHQLDILRYLLDEPDTVTTMGASGWVNKEGCDVDDLTTTMIRFRNGALGVLSSGCYATEGASFDSKITFSARDKRAVHRIIESLEIHEKEDFTPGEMAYFVTKGDGGLSKSANVTHYEQEGDAGLACDRCFIEAVISGDSSKIRSPYADALKTHMFALACNESLATGQTVKLAY
jgi:predicted dehydrogenase